MKPIYTFLILVLIIVNTPNLLAQNPKNKGFEIILVGIRFEDGASSNLTKYLNRYLKIDLTDSNVIVLSESYKASIGNLKEKWEGGKKIENPEDIVIPKNKSEDLPKYALFGRVDHDIENDLYSYYLSLHSLESRGSGYFYKMEKGQLGRIPLSIVKNPNSEKMEERVRVIHSKLYKKIYTHFTSPQPAFPKELEGK